MYIYEGYYRSLQKAIGLQRLYHLCKFTWKHLMMNKGLCWSAKLAVKKEKWTTKLPRVETD